MSYSIDVITDDCYEGTSCLINKFDIRDEKRLIWYNVKTNFDIKNRRGDYVEMEL